MGCILSENAAPAGAGGASLKGILLAAPLLDGSGRGLVVADEYAQRKSGNSQSRLPASGEPIQSTHRSILIFPKRRSRDKTDEVFVAVGNRDAETSASAWASRARPQPQPGSGRRAGVSARRFGAGADPQPVARVATATRPDLFCSWRTTSAWSNISVTGLRSCTSAAWFRPPKRRIFLSRRSILTPKHCSPPCRSRTPVCARSGSSWWVKWRTLPTRLRAAISIRAAATPSTFAASRPLNWKSPCPATRRVGIAHTNWNWPALRTRRLRRFLTHSQ